MTYGCFFGVRTEQDIIFNKQFEELAKNKKFHYVPVLSRSESPDYEHGHSQDAFKKLVTPANQDVYICGLTVMVDDVKAVCKELGYPDEKVHYEKYI